MLQLKKFKLSTNVFIYWPLRFHEDTSWTNYLCYLIGYIKCLIHKNGPLIFVREIFISSKEWSVYIPNQQMPPLWKCWTFHLSEVLQFPSFSTFSRWPDIKMALKMLRKRTEVNMKDHAKFKVKLKFRYSFVYCGVCMWLYFHVAPYADSKFEIFSKIVSTVFTFLTLFFIIIHLNYLIIHSICKVNVI